MKTEYRIEPYKFYHDMISFTILENGNYVWQVNQLTLGM